MDQVTTLPLPPPLVLDETPPSVYSPQLNLKIVKDNTESQEVENSSTGEDWDSDEEDEEVFVDSFEYPPEDPLPKKIFPNEAGFLLYGALKTHMDDRNTKSCSSSASTSSISGDGEFTASCPGTSITQETNHWSIDTIHTASARSVLSDVSSLSYASARSTGAIPHSSRSAPDIPGPASFGKGVPWGEDGRDYIPPSLKRHNLRETLRHGFRPKTGVFGRFTTSVGNIFRRLRPVPEVKQAKRRILIE
jgi:hypothetical protein